MVGDLLEVSPGYAADLRKCEDTNMFESLGVKSKKLFEYFSS